MDWSPTSILNCQATWNFDLASEEGNRSVAACWMRLHSYLMHMIKTYGQNSTLFDFNYFPWQIDVLLYLVHNKFEGVDDNDVCEMNNRVYPGQTLMSIKRFVKSVKGWQSQKIQTYQDKSLHERTQLRLHSQSTNCLCIESSTNPRTH